MKIKQIFCTLEIEYKDILMLNLFLDDNLINIVDIDI